MVRRRQNVIVGLDIGTTKICVIIGESRDATSLEIIGVGSQPCRGLKKGVVVNIDATVESIRQAVDEAQIMAGVDVTSVFVGIAGGHIKGINSTGIIAVKHQEITLREINQVIDAARAVSLPMDREAIHVLAQEYIVDDQAGILDPLGMAGRRLEARVHIVTAAVASAHNIVKCVNTAGLEVEDIVLEQLASAEATLTPDEREHGAVIIDIGGGTTDIALLVANSVKHTAVLGLGGSHITNDLAIGLNLVGPEAERFKKAYGCAYSPLVQTQEPVEMTALSDRQSRRFTRLDLCNIIEPRAEEMLQMAHREIMQSGYTGGIPSGIVLTGGTALLHGIVELAEDVFHMPVRRGVPSGMGGLTGMVSNPKYATGVGLVQYGVKQQPYGAFRKFNGEHLFARIYYRMRDWFSEFLL
ncbi:Cell division protein FtsA [Candidatus Entotheonellaceae bacterium PAL068K]